MPEPFLSMAEPQIFLVSPNAHYPSHAWPITAALMRALRAKGKAVQTIIYSSTAEPVAPDLRAAVVSATLDTPEAGRAVAGKWQDRRFGGAANTFETLVCLARARRLAGGRPAAFHFIGGSYWCVVLAALFCRRARFVYSLYDAMLLGRASGPKAWLRHGLKWLLRRACATGRLEFTCENGHLRGEISKLVGSHVTLVPYAVDDTEAMPARAAARQKLGLPADEKILLFFGTHRREKDYRTVLQGCRQLPEPPLALFVGKVISDNDPARLVAELQYPKARVVNEFVPEADAKFYFAAADAVALPYEAEFARGSGVLIECCRYLRPMVAAANPFFSAFIARHGCGATYAPGDPASLAAAVQSVFAGPEKFTGALARARREHSWAAAAEKYFRLCTGESRDGGRP